MPQRKKKPPELSKVKIPELPSLAGLLRDLGFLTDKTTTKAGKAAYMRAYMKIYRDRKRQRKYSPRKRRKKKRRRG